MSDKEKVSQWMMNRGYATGHGTSVVDLLQELEWQVAEREREACAKLCETFYNHEAKDCAEAIRANRSQATTSEFISNRTPEVTPDVDAVNISEEHVHKSDKSIHEPVAWHEPGSFGHVTIVKKWALENGWKPLYTAPPKREWVGLTEDELEDLEFASVDREYGHLDIRVLSRAIESKLKEKNA